MILQYLTTYGAASAVAVANGVGVHRTTVKRVLETLRVEGYVWFEEETKKYHITDLVLSFINGARSTNPVIRAFSEIEHDIAKSIPWPVDLTLFSEGFMVVKNSTHRLSPLSFHRRIIGRKLSCVRSAAGRAYLAFSSDNVRRDILSMICDMDDAERLYIERSDFNVILEATRQRGWAANNGEIHEDSKFAAIAVPVMAGGVAYGCLGAVFLKRSMSAEQAAAEYHASLRDLAAEISKRSERADPQAAALAC